MKKRTLIIALVLVALVTAFAGCGDKDETPVVSKSKQTNAMVPDSVNEDDLNDASDPNQSAADVRPEGDQGTPSDLPVDPPHTSSNENPDLAGAGQTSRVPPPAENAEQVPAAPPATNMAGRFSVQLGSFNELPVAEAKAAQLRELGHAAVIEQAEVGGRLYHRLLIRGLPDRASAEKLGEDLHSSLGFSYLVKRR